MVTRVKITWQDQTFRAVLCVVTLMLIVWPSGSQELKGAKTGRLRFYANAIQPDGSLLPQKRTTYFSSANQCRTTAQNRSECFR
jgi:hypothetical protein